MDVTLFFYIHGLTEIAPALNPIFSFVANGLGVFLFLYVVIDIIVKTKSIQKDFMRIGRLLLTTVSALAFTNILKYIIARPRPFEVLDIEPLLAYGGGDSFPSGHATFYMALALISFEYLPKRHAVIFLIIALLISVGRIVVGVHYPSDIAMGWIIALISSLFIKAIWPIQKVSK
jgi:undecaprenyl-diphosphatase